MELEAGGRMEKLILDVYGKLWSLKMDFKLSILLLFFY